MNHNAHFTNIYLYMSPLSNVLGKIFEPKQE